MDDFRNDKLNLRRLSKLYGRSEDLSTLIEAYDRVASRDETSSDRTLQRSELVLVTGYSGTGKSTLVWRLRDHHQQHTATEEGTKGLFASGKFELLHRSEPYSAIVVAFDDLFSQILGSVADNINEDESVQSMLSLRQRTRDEILKTVGDEGIKTLSSLIPKLGQVMSVGRSCEEDTESRKSSTSIEARNSAFRSLVQALGEVARLVFFLDDLQWADSASLDLLTALLIDNQSANVLYVGTYRDNEVDSSHPLSIRLRELENHVDASDRLSTTRIRLGNLSRDTVNDLISDVLRLEPLETSSLTQVVYDRTHGNAFFVIRFLESLHDEGLLAFSFGLYRWTWDVDRILSDTRISDNVVDLMKDKIRKRLSPEDRFVLTLAACFGSRFDAQLLKLYVTTNQGGLRRSVQQGSKNEHPEVNISDDIEKHLGVAIDEGLLEPDRFVSKSKLYRFAHDRIHQAAYSLIPAGSERELMHMQIGELINQQRTLMQEKDGNTPTEDWMMFAATDQLNRGSTPFIQGSPGKRVELSKLNLEAGQKAMQSSAFVPAASYLNKSISLLAQTNQWRDHYALTLELYNASSTAEYGCGNYGRSQQLAEDILVSATRDQDRLVAINSMSKNLRNQRKNTEALEFCINISAQMGHKLPKNPVRIAVKLDFLMTRRMVLRLSDEEIINLPLLKDKDANSYTAQLICPLLTNFTNRLLRWDLTTLSVCRAVQLMIGRGLCYFSPMTFAVFGCVLCKEGYYQEGYHCGQVAISLSKKLNVEKAWEASLTFMLYGYLHFWVNGHHIQECLDPMLRNYETAMLSGDIYIAFLSILGYCLMYIYSGLSLRAIETDLRAYALQMKNYKQDAMLALVLPTWQYVQNLMGKSSSDPLCLSGDVMDQEHVTEQSYKAGDLLSVMFILFLQLDLAYYFGNVELAAKLAKKSREYARRLDPTFVICRHSFMDGLVSLALAKETKRVARRKRVLRPAYRAVKKMQKWVECGSGNALHMLSLLNAEFHSLNNKKSRDEVKKSYDEAISTAGRSGFSQDKALANERAGVFFSELVRSNGDNEDAEYWASFYLSQAHELYLDWGAIAKADQLLEKYGSTLIQTETLRKNGVQEGHRSRSRFTDGTKSHKRLDYATGLGPEDSSAV